MARCAAFLLAFALILSTSGVSHAQTRTAPYTPGYTTVPPVVLPQTGIPSPQLTAPTLAPTLTPPVQVSPPPPPEKKDAEGDGGSCTCPAGEKADAEGWCWRATDPEHGYWERTQQCE